MAGLDERDLAARCAERDPRAWGELVARFDRRILLVLLRGGVPETEIPDLRQEIYRRLLEDGGAPLRRLRAEREGSLGAFLGQVALRMAIDHGRARGNRARSEVDEAEAHALPTSVRSPEEEAALRQRRERFARAVIEASQGRDPERDLMILRSHFFDGLNPQEISAMGCGLSAKGVETLLRRARIAIESSLSRLAAEGRMES